MSENGKIKVCIGLSGGVDSSYVVSLLKPDKTYTASFDTKYSKYDEIGKAKDLCEKLKIHNKASIVTKEEYLDEFQKTQAEIGYNIQKDSVRTCSPVKQNV